MHVPSRSIRIYKEAVMPRLIPVPKAIYPARHAGHLGRRIRISVGSDHRVPVRTSDLRVRDDGAGKPSVATLADVALGESRLQQWIIYLASCSQQPDNNESLFGAFAVFAVAISCG